MGTHDVVDALLFGARDALNDDLATPGATRVVSLSAHDADLMLTIIERCWEALASGHITGRSCDALDAAFRALALAATGPGVQLDAQADAQARQSMAPRPPLAVIR